jgi:hypothetical protein
MPVHMGIMCEKCRKVHFIATSPCIAPTPTTERMYVLTCRCREEKDFRKEGMRPYRVSDEVFQTGFAEEVEYELVPAVVKGADDTPQGTRKSSQSLTNPPAALYKKITKSR